MWDENSVFHEDIKDIKKVDFIPWDNLKNKKIFITGATGLIGSTLIKSLGYINEQKHLSLELYALVRNEEKAKVKFGHLIDKGILNFVTEDVVNLNSSVIKDLPIMHYIIHGASQTASKEFVNHAVETIKTALLGTMNTLELAKKHKVLGYVYLSSMEMYGYPERGHKVTEKESGAMTPLECRNSYPISKQMSEAMCCAYAYEYNVPAKIIRLTQTFGPEINHNDNRIFAYFARCANEKQDIVLKTSGETERSYLYTLDAVTAILTILLKGQIGQAYNAADEKTYCSITEMAKKVAADAGIKVIYDVQDVKINGYPETLYMNLDTRLLKSLGWKPIVRYYNQ